MNKGIGGHQRAFRGRSDNWLTPPDLLAKLGGFDLDPCVAVGQPWSTATNQYTIKDDGLVKPWAGRVFCNPPYGPETGKWLKKCAEHSHGTALIFARTETAMFHRWVWEQASAILFLEGRLHFYDLKGERAPHNAGGPSCLVAYGAKDADILAGVKIPGAFVRLRR